MQVTRWDPFREMDDFSDRLSRALSTALFTPPRTKSTSQEELVLADWAPLVDVEETEKEFLVKAELPEVKKEDVKVTIEDGLLSIEGERRHEKEEKTRKVHRIERSFGKFVRRFTVPPEAENAKVTAEFKDGVLYVHVPKTEAAKPRTIEVKVA